MRVSILFQNGKSEEIYNVCNLETNGSAVGIVFKVGKSHRTLFYENKTIKMLSIMPNYKK